MLAGNGGATPAHGVEWRPSCAQADPAGPQAGSPSPWMRRRHDSPRLTGEVTAQARESVPAELLDVLREDKRNSVGLCAL